MKPEKICVENPDHPISGVFTGHDWKLSGGTKQAGVLAAAFILANDVNTVIEIGLWFGFSSKILAKALESNAGKDGYLISIDINPRAIERSLDATEGIDIHHRPITADSVTVNYQDALKGRSLGLAFIDGNHDYEHTIHDMNQCGKYLKRYGIMIVHDYNKNEYTGVWNAVNEYIVTTGYPLFYIHENKESTDYRTAIIQKM